MEDGGVRRKSCARCHDQHKGCEKDCIFAPHFPADQPEKYRIVHEVFSAHNVRKILQELPVDKRGAAVMSMYFEALIRKDDPVHGCYGQITNLESQVEMLKSQLWAALTGEVGENQMLQSQPMAVLMEEIERLKVLRAFLLRDVQMLERRLTALTGGGGEVQRLQSQLSYLNDKGQLHVMMLEAPRLNATQAPASLSNSGLLS